MTSRQLSSASAEAYPRIEVDFSLSGNDFFLPCHSPIEWKFLTPEEEILFGPACWLWDYLRRDATQYKICKLEDTLQCSKVKDLSVSWKIICALIVKSKLVQTFCTIELWPRSGQGGFFLPLSGGVDSSSTATIVFSMCNMVVEAVTSGEEQVLADVRKVVGDPGYTPRDAKELCNRIFVTCYMGSENSSEDTRDSIQ